MLRGLVNDYNHPILLAYALTSLPYQFMCIRSGYLLFKKQIIVSKLKSLENKQALLEIAQKLLPEVTGVHQTYADLDSMSVAQLQTMTMRLGNIKNLMKCTFE